MAKKEIINKSEKNRKYEHIFTSNECVSIWKYDLDKFANGPISVEHKWDNEYLKRMELKQRRGR
jgi:hypothetical protein